MNKISSTNNQNKRNGIAINYNNFILSSSQKIITSATKNLKKLILLNKN